MISAAIGGILSAVYQTPDGFFGLVVPSYRSIIRVESMLSTDTHYGQWFTPSAVDGKRNTEQLVASGLLNPKAAHFNFNGFTDWYIPSIFELMLLLNPDSVTHSMYQNRIEVKNEFEHSLDRVLHVWSSYKYNSVFNSELIPTDTNRVLTSSIYIDNDHSFDMWCFNLYQRTKNYPLKLYDKATIYYDYANRNGWIIPIRKVRLQ